MMHAVTRSRVLSVGLVVSLVATAGSVATGARAAAITMCGLHAVAVASGNYIVDSNEYNSPEPECVSTNGGPDFTVAESGVNSPNNSPEAYPSIYAGCHWGLCSGNGLTATPLPVTALAPGMVTSSWSTTQPGDGVYDVAYDVWFNQTPQTASLKPDCAELMVWLNHSGQVRPYGARMADNVSVDGRTYDIFFGRTTVSYEMTAGVSSVSNLDIGALALDAAERGLLPSACYLIDVEAGFELWQGGQGLTTNSFSVNAWPSATPSPSASPSATTSSSASPSASPSPSPSPSPTAGPTCSAKYSVVSKWPGGFQGEVTITSHGASALRDWTAAWTLPRDQQITELWNGVATQVGSLVAATGSALISPGSSVTLGFIATGASSRPIGFTLDGNACG